MRQLRNLVDRLAVFAEDDEITPATLAAVDAMVGTEGERAPDGEEAQGESSQVSKKPTPSLQTIARALVDLMPGRDPIAAIEGALIAEALSRAGGRKTQAAEILGIHRKVIERRLGRAAAELEGASAEGNREGNDPR